MRASSGRLVISSTLNLFSVNISSASSRVTSIRWKGCFSLMIFSMRFWMPSRSWSDSVRSPR